jgi:hypothetical protein
MPVYVHSLLPHNAERMIGHRCNLLNDSHPYAVLVSFGSELAEVSIVEVPIVPELLRSLV